LRISWPSVSKSSTIRVMRTSWRIIPTRCFLKDLRHPILSLPVLDSHLTRSGHRRDLEPKGLWQRTEEAVQLEMPFALALLRASPAAQGRDHQAQCRWHRGVVQANHKEHRTTSHGHQAQWLQAQRLTVIRRSSSLPWRYSEQKRHRGGFALGGPWCCYTCGWSCFALVSSLACSCC